MSKSQYRTFWVPADDPGDASETLNHFLRSHALQSVDRQFVASPMPGWAFCVVYSEINNGGNTAEAKTRKTDYRAMLGPDEQVTWDHLRDLRTTLARDEGKKAFYIFSNLQLYYLISHRVLSLAALGDVPDWGESRTQKYGEKVLALLQKTLPEELPK